jgi:chromosome segregation ATPase
MSEVDYSLMLAILRKLQAQQGDVVLRLGNLEESSASMSGRIASIEAGLAGVNKRLDRFDHRLDRIETRLGLIEA